MLNLFVFIEGIDEHAKTSRKNRKRTAVFEGSHLG